MARTVPLQRGESRLVTRAPLLRYTGLPQATRPLRAVPPLPAAGLPRTAVDGPGRQRTEVGTHPFPPAIQALIDARDVAQPDEVRCCQRCGITSGLHRHHRRGKADGLIPQLNMGAKVAELITREFPDSTVLAGRVLVAASRAMAGLLESARSVGLPCEDVARLMTNVLASAGEQTAHPEPGGPE